MPAATEPAHPPEPTPSESDELFALFHAGSYGAMEARSRALLERHPDSGFVWKALGTALRLQDKDALDVLRQAAALLPNDAEAHNNLGGALKLAGQLEAAQDSYRRALEIDPGFAVVHFGMAGISQTLGKHEDAVASYRRAIACKPDYADAYNNLGNALREMGRFEEAAEIYRRALALKPDAAGTHNNLGNALIVLDRPEEAAKCYRQALALKPDYEEAHLNLGLALKQLGHMQVAVASFRRVLEINPGHVEAHISLGSALQEQGGTLEAISYYRQALALQPEHSGALLNLGNALQDQGKSVEAEACYRRALEIEPDYANAHLNLGIVLTAVGRLEEALATYRRALEIDPGFAKAYLNLGSVLKDTGQPDAAITHIRRALEIQPDYVDAQGSLLFIHNYMADQPVERLLAEARHLGKMVAQKARPFVTWSNVDTPKRSLRVGLVSGDFRIHPVGYFIESVLAAMASRADTGLEVIAYYNHFVNDTLTERIKACCQGWHSTVRLSDESLAAKIHGDGIDILIDLSGCTAHGRLPVFAWKPAPVQASWLGYFATTGVAEVDYLIADPWVVPEAEEAHFVEKIWRLPETYLCFTEPDVGVRVAPPPALANGYITFGCFNNLAKMNDAVVALWARVLGAVPGSRLFLKTKQLGDASVRQSTIDRFAAHGIDAGRLILEGFAPRAELLASYHRVDIALDPFPYPGGTTSVEALWMGVPVITRRGDRFLSHVGETIAHNAGMSGWIAADEDDYVAKAAHFASDPEQLAGLRVGLRQQVLSSPLFDAPRFARHFEEAMQGMWNNYLEQKQS